MVSWGWIKPNPAVGIENDLDEERGVEKEKVEGSAHLQMSRFLSSPAAPQRDGDGLAHIAFDKIPHIKVLQVIGSLQKEKRKDECAVSNVQSACR